MRAADKAANNQQDVDERTRRKNAAKQARDLLERKSDSMPVVASPDGPRQIRVVDAELVDPSPTGGIVEVLQQGYLLRLIVGRQLAQQYAASVLGLLWSYIQPAMRFAVYFFVFGVILKTHQGVPNFALRLFTAMVFVHYFTETWNGGTRSIWQNSNLVLKMRVPREIFPVAAMLVSVYHTGPQVLLLIVCCVIVGWHFSLGAIGAGLIGIAILVTFSMAMALFFSALNVLYRDFQNIVQTIMQFIHFLVPMMYSYSVVAELGKSHPLLYQGYMANPLAEAVLLMQKLFWAPTVSDQSLLKPMFPSDLISRGLITLGVCIVLLYLSQKFFSRLESKFPENL